MTLPKVDNFVDGAAVARIGDHNFEALKSFRPDQVLIVPENAICVTMTDMLNVEGVVLEPAGALALAARTCCRVSRSAVARSLPSSPAATSTSNGCPTSRSAPCATPA